EPVADEVDADRGGDDPQGVDRLVAIERDASDCEGAHDGQQNPERVSDHCCVPPRARSYAMVPAGPSFAGSRAGGTSLRKPLAVGHFSPVDSTWPTLCEQPKAHRVAVREYRRAQASAAADAFLCLQLTD